MDNEQLIQAFIQNFTGTKKREVEEFLRTLVDNQVSFAEATRRANREFNTTRQTVGDIAGSISGVLSSLTSTNRTVNEGSKSFRKLESIVRKIQDDQFGIYNLSLKELKNTRAKTASEIQRLKFISEELSQKKSELTPAEEELLRISQSSFENQKAILGVIDERIDKQKKLDSALGITGAVLDNLNKIGIRALGGIGINLGTLEDAFDSAKQGALEAAQNLEGLANSDEINDFSKRIVTLTASLKGVGQGIQEIFNDPLTLFVGLISKATQQVTALNEAQNKVRRLTGETAYNFQQINSRAVTALDITNSIANITEQIGLNAESIFNRQQLLNIAEAQELLSLSAEQATKLGILSKLNNQTQESFNNNLLAGADSANQLFKSAVPPGVALREAANASSDIFLSLGMVPSKLGSAATAAKALGLELSRIDNIAESLLDFESSIQNELEAQLITGRNINLSRARELALTNDLEGLSRELANNSVTAAEFANMNRIQQNSIAKALGMSRSELAEVVLQQEIVGNLTDEQRAKVLGVNQSQLEQLDIQKSIEKSIQSITHTLAGPLELFASILENTGLIYASILGIGTVAIAKIVIGAATAKKAFNGVTDQVRELNRQLAISNLLAQGISIDKRGRFRYSKGAPGGKGGQFVADDLIRNLGGANLLKGAGKQVAKKGVGGLLAGLIGGSTGALLMGALALAPLAMGAYSMMKTREGDDIISKPGYGDRVLLDKGTITPLYNGDTIFAASNAPTQMSSGGRRVEQLLERLIANTEKTGAVYIDGREVGTAMVMNSYKSS